MVGFGQSRQAADPHGDNNKDMKDMHGLIIYGQDFAFIASEPNDWDVDTEDAAKEYQVNAIFFPRDPSSRSHHVTIRVRVNHKSGEDPQDDMTFDVNQYKKDYPKTQFTELSVKHAEYPTAAKLFYTKGEFYEYVAYLNPGPQVNLMFSVAMSKENKPATQDELAAFVHVLQSLKFLTQNVKGPSSK